MRTPLLSLILGAALVAAACPRECAAAEGPSTAAAAIDVRVDPRVELVTVMARLAGFDEYQTPGIADYDRAVDEHFAAFREHASIRLLRRLREDRGIGYNAPIELALAADGDTWSPAVELSPWPGTIDRRWDAAGARQFLAAAAQFERDTRAREFFAAQQPLYDQVQAAVSRNLRERLRSDWYLARMPSRRISGFRVVPGLLAGNNSYGASLRYADGRELVFGILATPPHRAGEAIGYPADAQLALLAHEFHHPYMNPWADAHAAILLPAAERLFRAVQPRMKALAYGEPRIMLYESLVRANTQRYLRQHGEDAVLRRAIREDRDKGFPWTPALAELFDSLEAGAADANGARSRPAWDEATALRVAALLDDWGRDDGAKVAAEQKRLAAEDVERLASGPQIVRYVPAQGAVVGADLTTLELHFDRAMAPGLAIFGDPPEVTGKPSWDQSRRVLRIPVRVQPGASYTLMLNNEETARIKDADGNALVPRVWNFRVKEATD
jgi:hypothetical protein